MPLRLGRWHLAVEAVLVAAVILLASAVQCAGATQDAEDAKAQQLAANSYKAAMLSLARRRTTDSLTTAVLVTTAKVKEQARVIRRLDRAADSLLAANDTLLAMSDSTCSPSCVHLRDALSKTSAAFRTYRDSTSMLLAAVDTLVARHAAERAAFHAERLATDSLIAAKDAEIRHWQRRATCRVGPMRCPTRLQTFAAGFLLALLL